MVLGYARLTSVEMRGTPEVLTNAPARVPGRTFMDVVLDMLQRLRLNGGLFLDAEFTAPWCVRAQVGPEDCLPFVPQPRHIIAYHYVTEGELLLKVAGHPPVRVPAGAVVVLPRNDPHVIGSALARRAISAEQLIVPGPDGGLARIVHGGGGACTRVLCGFLGSDMAHSPVLGMLPNVLTLDIAEAASAGWLESSFRFAAHQLAGARLESPAILAKLAELLFMEAVRRYVATFAPEQGGWIAGMQDPLIARALGLVHGDVRRRWTTDELAHQVGLSRSAFADRFTRVMGQPPMRYLTRHRLERAAAQLGGSGESIARIAYDVGYESEAAFSRAFSREYGVTPAVWRKEHGQR
jgi:AraC-like DNA-binding protein